MARITINIELNDGDTLDDALAKFGYIRRGDVSSLAVTAADPDQFDPNAYKVVAGDAELREAIKDAGVTLTTPQPVETPLSEMDGDRKRGEAAPGHRRRTNKQIAEDEAYFEQKKRAEAALAAMDKGVHAEPADLKRERFEDANISTGAERINPEDAADEAAETEARKSDTPTLEDLRAEVARYIEKFGHAASVKNMRGIIGYPVADCPADKIAEAIAKVKAAIGGEPEAGEDEGLFGQAEATVDAPALDVPVTATSAEVVDAIKAYGKKYDGSDIPDAMVFTKEDLPKVFTATFGAGVTGLGSLPNKEPETLGKILVAIKTATEQNPFKREAKS